MPAGVTWPVYLRFSFAAMISMLAGAQCVHAVYKPLQDLDELVEKEKEDLLKSQEEPHPSEKKETQS